MTEAFFISLIVVLIMMVIFFWSRFYKQRDVIDQLRMTIDSNWSRMQSISKDKDSFYDRILELEKALEDGFGITVRQEVTKVEVNFSKLEMVLILAGINILLERSKNVEDSKHYISLIEKIQGFIDYMKEEEVS